MKRRSPLQFSLRLLFQLILVAAAFFGGWVANDWKRERELRRLQQLPVATPIPASTINYTLTIESDVDTHNVRLFYDQTLINDLPK
jgi:hypothetical protein